MKKLIVVGLMLTIACVFADPEEDRDWEEFKIKYRQFYLNRADEFIRKSIFLVNRRSILEHNQRAAQGLESYTQEINQFAAMTDEEFESFYLSQNAPSSTRYPIKPLTKQSAPRSVSWFSPSINVKNQAACGSCWAFSAVGTVEYAYQIFRGENHVLAEQELVDCNDADGENFGCNGGWQDLALKYIKEEGISVEADYPYEAKDGPCRAQKRAAINVTEVYETEVGEESYRRNLYENGPLAVDFWVDSKSFKAYKEGIYRSTNCNKPNGATNHAVILIGYGVENGTEYWLLRNSWGSNFGEKGHFRMLRGQMMCNLSANPGYFVDIA